MRMIRWNGLEFLRGANMVRETSGKVYNTELDFIKSNGIYRPIKSNGGHYTPYSKVTRYAKGVKSVPTLEYIPTVVYNLTDSDKERIHNLVMKDIERKERNRNRRK